MTTATATKRASTLDHVNRLCYGDNLDTLRTLPSESVDLVYLDPPYNSKRVYNRSFGAKAQARLLTITGHVDKKYPLAK